MTPTRNVIVPARREDITFSMVEGFIKGEAGHWTPEATIHAAIAAAPAFQWPDEAMMRAWFEKYSTVLDFTWNGLCYVSGETDIAFGDYCAGIDRLRLYIETGE